MIRVFLGRRHAFDAMDRTTSEIMDLLRGRAPMNGAFERIQVFLEGCDLVKFAKYAPTNTEADLVITTATKFIEETKDVHI